MAFGNVIPIDADVARQLARRQVRFRWLVAGLVALWLAALVPTLLFTPLPPLVPFLALALLAVLAEHRYVLFGDETSMSASIIVVVASIFVFADTAPLAGPLLIASIAGLYLPHLRSGAFDKVAFNGSCMGVAACFASIAALRTQGLEGSPIGTLLAVLPPLTVYWCINNFIVAGHQATLCGNRFGRSAATLITSDTEVLLWAAAATIGVASVDTHSNAAIAFVVAVVSWRIALLHGARSRSDCSSLSRAHEDAVLVWLGALALLISNPSPRAIDVAIALSVALVLPTLDVHNCRLISVGLPLLALISLESGPAVIGLVVGACVAILALPRRSTGHWTASVALGALVTMLIVPNNLISARELPILAAATATPVAVAVIVYGCRAMWSSRTIGIWTAIGIAMPSPLGLLVGIWTVGIAALVDRTPVSALALATALIALRCLPLPNGQRSPVRASR